MTNFDFDWQNNASFSIGPASLLQGMYNSLNTVLNISPLKWLEEGIANLQNTNLEAQTFLNNARNSYAHLRNTLNPTLSPEGVNTMNNFVGSMDQALKNAGSTGASVRIFKPIVGRAEDLRDAFINSLSEEEVNYLVNAEQTCAAIIIFQLDAAKTSLLFTLLLAIIGVFIDPKKAANLMASIADNPFFNQLKNIITVFLEELTKIGELALDIKNKVIDGFGKNLADAVMGNPEALDQNLGQFLDSTLDVAGDVVNDLFYKNPLDQTSKQLLETVSDFKSSIAGLLEKANDINEKLEGTSLSVNIVNPEWYRARIVDQPKYEKLISTSGDGVVFYPKVLFQGDTFDSLRLLIGKTDSFTVSISNILTSEELNRPTIEDIRSVTNKVAEFLDRKAGVKLPGIPDPPPDPPKATAENQKGGFNKTLSVLEKKLMNPLNDFIGGAVAAVAGQSTKISEAFFNETLKPILGVYIDSLNKYNTILVNARTAMVKEAAIKINTNFQSVQSLTPEDPNSTLGQYPIGDGLFLTYDTSYVYIPKQAEDVIEVASITQQSEDSKAPQSLQESYENFEEEMASATDSPYLDKWLSVSLGDLPTTFLGNLTGEITEGLFKTLTAPTQPSPVVTKIDQIASDVDRTLFRYTSLLASVKDFLLSILEFMLELTFVPFIIYPGQGDIGRLRFILNDQLNTQKPGAPTDEQLFVPIMFVSSTSNFISDFITKILGDLNAS